MLPPSTAVPLPLVCSIVAQTSTLPRSFDFKLVWPFLIGGLAGVPLGTMLVAHADPRVFKLSVGVLLLVFPAGLYFNRKPMALSFGGRVADAAIGFAGGILGGLAGLSGPLPTLWASVRGWSKDQRRGIFQTYNWTVLTAALCLQAATGFHHLRSGLARIVVPAGIVVRRLARRAGLSRAQRQKFSRCRAWPVVSVRARPGVEQFRSAVTNIVRASGLLRTENTKIPA